MTDENLSAAPADYEEDAEGGTTTLPQPSIWESLRRLIWPAPDERRAQWLERLEELNTAVTRYPEEPVNYILRGELLLQLGEYVSAVRDFQTGFEAASRQVETSNWGLMAQGMQDRAHAGLVKARRLAGLQSQDTLLDDYLVED